MTVFGNAVARRGLLSGDAHLEMRRAEEFPGWPGTRRGGNGSARMTFRSRSPADGMGAAVGIPLLAYSLVFGLFVIFLYWLLQPSRVSNPGLAAYVPPPGTVVSYE